MPKCIEKEKYLGFLSNILIKTFPEGEIRFSIRGLFFSSRVYVMIVGPNIFLSIKKMVV